MEQVTEPANIFTEQSVIERTLEQTNKEYYTKQDIQQILTPIFNYLELISDTYDITLENDLIYTYRRPDLTKL